MGPSSSDVAGVASSSRNHFQHSPGVLGTSQADTTVLLDVNGGMYYTLNEAGGRIWDLVGAGFAVPSIINQLQEEYDVAPETLAADTAVLIDRLLKAKLLRTAGR